MIEIVRRVLSAWRDWREVKARRRSPSLTAERQRVLAQIERARRLKLPVADLYRELRDITHARLRAELKIEA